MDARFLKSGVDVDKEIQYCITRFESKGERPLKCKYQPLISQSLGHNVNLRLKKKVKKKYKNIAHPPNKAHPPKKAQVINHQHQQLIMLLRLLYKKKFNHINRFKTSC